MSIKKKLIRGSSKAVQAVMAGVLTVGLMPLPAFAADLTAGSQQISAQASQKSSDGQIIAAAFAAAEPAPEILGLNNLNFRQQSNSDEVADIAKIFGDDEINEAVNPYVYNQVNKLGNGVIYGGRQGGPTAALGKYDTAANSKAAQNNVWKAKPNVVLGTGKDTYPDGANEEQWDFYDSKDYARAAETANGWAANSYHPIAVTYNRVSLPTMVGTMYRLSEAVAKVQAQSGNENLKTRYQDTATAADIAKDYERYVVGSKGAVKWAIDNNKVKQKTVACVNNYDATANTYRIITSGFSEGTASTNRYLETIAGVANDYYDAAPNKSTYEETTTGGGGTTTSINKCAYVTADDLRNSVDVIVVGAAAGAGNDSDVIKQLSSDGLLVKTFYCSDWGVGSVFGTTVNSVENAQNVGRILPCVYPEVLDQSDMIAYYYDVFYHVKDGKLAETIDKNMDGVRNWDNTDSAALTSWSASDVSGYNQAKTEALLKSGVAYLNSQASALASNPSKDYLIPTSNLAADGTTPGTIEVKKTQTITADDVTKTVGDAAFPLNAKTDGDGKLSYLSNNESVVTVSSSGTVTVKGAGSTQIIVTASATNNYARASKVVLVTVNEKAATATTTATGLAKGKSATTGSGASAAKVKATSATAVTYVAPKSTKTKTVKVPDTVTVNGKKYKVTAIAANAFKGSKATKITVGKNVKTIGKKAFSGATKLKTLTLGKSVKTVKANALKGAKKLTKLTLKSSSVTKASMKNLLKGSKVKTVKTSGVSKKAKKNYKKWAKAYGVTVK